MQCQSNTAAPIYAHTHFSPALIGSLPRARRVVRTSRCASLCLSPTRRGAPILEAGDAAPDAWGRIDSGGGGCRNRCVGAHLCVRPVKTSQVRDAKGRHAGCDVSGPRRSRADTHPLEVYDVGGQGPTRRSAPTYTWDVGAALCGRPRSSLNSRRFADSWLPLNRAGPSAAGPRLTCRSAGSPASAPANLQPG
jgi:hypothetical protein